MFHCIFGIVKGADPKCMDQQLFFGSTPPHSILASTSNLFFIGCDLSFEVTGT